MENEVHCCINCFRLEVCCDFDVKLDDPGLYLETECPDYITIEDLDN